MSKNIVVFSDGTGQEGGKSDDTNIYTLFKAIKNRTPAQISFYDRGIGAEARGLWKWWTWARRKARQTTGWGFSKNVRDCYQFIFDNYEAGDKIYLFGFSRGAATVRSTAGFIHMFGILPKSRPELIKEAYKIYKIRNQTKRLDLANDFYEKHNAMWADIEFIGVWDTVAALYGFGDFHDFSLSPSVRNAYHALSIDDKRKEFHPVLWDESLLDHQSMQQMWFCGVHTDVGGGYPETGLSLITLHWLLHHAMQHGLLLYNPDETETPDILKFTGNPDGPMHDSRDKLWKKIVFRFKERSWPEVDSSGKPRGAPNIHESVHKRTRGDGVDPDAPYHPWILK